MHNTLVYYTVGSAHPLSARRVLLTSRVHLAGSSDTRRVRHRGCAPNDDEREWSECAERVEATTRNGGGSTSFRRFILLC